MFRQILTSVLVVTGLAGVAQADIIYVAQRNADGAGAVYAYDTADGSALSGFAPITYTAGNNTSALAVSPNGTILYVRKPGDANAISTYNAATGALLNANFVTGLANTINGMSVDPATGNLYAANRIYGVTRITPAGAVNENWGAPVSTGAYPEGTVVYNGKVYAAQANSTNPVVSYPLPGGGSPTTVVSGVRSDWPAFDDNGSLYTIEASASTKYVQKWNVATNTHANFGNFGFTTNMYATPILYNENDGFLYVAAPKTKYPISSGYSGIYKIDTNAASPSYITLVDTGAAPYPYFAAATLYAIPEPSTLVLLAGGLLGLLAYAWRKRK
ncbi:MAG: PEP-CTERM sorting domain-containing protein [Pirellulaceae bacterium]|nr:PEP-CTERM sorting domain-containing protein [Pirellulaceae bacterium]